MTEMVVELLQHQKHLYHPEAVQLLLVLSLPEQLP
jgi:hypothetical protein